MKCDTVVELENIVTQFGSTVIHDHVNIEVRRNEVLGIIGGSGTGKTVLLRVMLMLTTPTEGRLSLFGRPIVDAATRAMIRQRIGVMFQSGGLFGDLTVLENVCFPLREFTRLSTDSISALGRLKVALVGLPAEAANRLPTELSGGMLKRASIARALAMDPEILFLDEPSAGLDPASVAGLDQLIVKLRDDLGMTIVMISHDLDSLNRVSDRVAFLGEQRVLATGPIAELRAHAHPLIAAYFAASDTHLP